MIFFFFVKKHLCDVSAFFKKNWLVLLIVSFRPKMSNFQHWPRSPFFLGLSLSLSHFTFFALYAVPFPVLFPSYLLSFGGLWFMVGWHWFRSLKLYWFQREKEATYDYGNRCPERVKQYDRKEVERGKNTISLSVLAWSSLEWVIWQINNGLRGTPLILKRRIWLFQEKLWGCHRNFSQLLFLYVYLMPSMTKLNRSCNLLQNLPFSLISLVSCYSFSFSSSFCVCSSYLLFSLSLSSLSLLLFISSLIFVLQ